MGKETTKGTAVPPTLWLPQRAPTPEDTISQLEGKGYRGSMTTVFEVVQGLKAAKFDWSGDVYPDSMAGLLSGILGSTDGMPSTTIAVGSNGGLISNIAAWANPSPGVLAVASTANFPTAGMLNVAASGATVAVILYTGTTGGNQFTGCTYLQGSPAGTVSTGGNVTGMHTYSQLNTGNGEPPAWTAGFWDGLEYRAFPGWQCTDLTFKWNVENLFEYDAKGLAYISTTPATQTNTQPTTAPEQSWVTTFQVAGVSNVHFSEATLNLKRAGKVHYTHQGLQTPYVVWVDALDLTGDIVFLMESDTEYNYFINNVEQAFLLNVTEQNVGSNGYGLTFQMSKVHPMTATKEYGKDLIEVKETFRALPTTTDATAGGVSPIQIRLANAATTAF